MNISLTQSIHLAKAASTSNNVYALERALKAVEYYMCAIISNEYLNTKYSSVLAYFARKLESKLMGLEK